MKYTGSPDLAAAGILVRGNGALVSFAREFDFTDSLPAQDFDFPLFRAEGGYPTMIRLVRVNYANNAIPPAWRAGIRQAGAIPNGCRDANYTAIESGLDIITGQFPGLNPIRYNGFIPDICRTEQNWEEDYLVKADGVVSLFFNWKSIFPNVNQALNPAGNVFIHAVRLM
jgi:hypothetical protein